MPDPEQGVIITERDRFGMLMKELISSLTDTYIAANLKGALERFETGRPKPPQGYSGLLQEEESYGE
jgi:hypothetical protein